MSETNRKEKDMPTLLTSRGSSERLAEQIMERMSSPTNVWGLPTGFKRFDRLTHGLQQEEMTVVIARPGVGKSALVGQIAMNVAKHFKSSGSNKEVRLISLEMSYDSWTQRLACYRADLSIFDVMSGHLKTPEYDRYMIALNEIGGLPIKCIDTEISLLNISQFVKQDNRCGLFIVDHIGITPGTDGNSFNTLNAASTMYRDLSKTVSPSIIISQMNRSSEMRQDKRPSLADVYGSDRIGQDARKVIGLYREDMYQKQSEEERAKPQPAELSIIKSNNGPLGVIDMVFHPTRMEWKEVENG